MRELTAQRHSPQAFLRTHFLPSSPSARGWGLLIGPSPSTSTHKGISMSPSNPQQGPTGTGTALERQALVPGTFLGPVELCCAEGGPLSRREVRTGGRSEAGTVFPPCCKCSDSPCGSGPVPLPDTDWVSQHFLSPPHLQIRHTLHTLRATRGSMQVPRGRL